MPVVVKDQAGVIIATTSTTFDHFVPAECAFKFAIESLPDATFYSIEVGHRGALTFSRAELEDRDWHVDFTLGR